MSVCFCPPGLLGVTAPAGSPGKGPSIKSSPTFDRVLQRDRSKMTFWEMRQRERQIMSSWFTWLWSLRSPTICYLPAGDPGQPVVGFSLNLKAWEPGEQSNTEERTNIQVIQSHRRGWILPASAFSSTVAFDGLDADHPQCGGQTTL